MTEIAASKEEINKALEGLEQAMERARRVRIESEAFLRATRLRREQRKVKLRRAGLLRD